LILFIRQKDNLMNHEEFLDSLLSLPNIEDDLLPLVSRDGKWAAWTWFNVGSPCDVFVVSTSGSTSPVRLTDTPETTYLVSWTIDSKAVIVAQDKNGNERDQLFRVDIDRPLEMIPLTEADPNYYVQGGQLHPNGRWLVYAANFDAVSGKELEETWLYRHDLTIGEKIPLAKPMKPVRMTPKLNLPGTDILYTRMDKHPAGRQIWIVGIDGLNDRELLNFGDDVKTFASWHPDGNQILVIAETPSHRRLGLTHKNTGKVQWLLDDPKLDIEMAYIPVNSNTIVVIKNQVGKMRAEFIDLDDLRRHELPQIPGNLLPIAPASAMDEAASWIGLFFSSQQPGEVVHFDVDHPSPQRFRSLSKVWDETNLTAADMCPAEDFMWHSVDDLEIHGWLYRAQTDVKGTVIYIHGGPTYHSRDMLNAGIQFFVHRGFHVLDINYRGSTGYGLPFREMILEDGWGGREQEDIRTGIEALIHEGIAEKGKIGITGTSYGGYSSWWAITHFPPEIVSAAAPICGMTDLVVDYETTRPDIRPYSEEMMGGSPLEVPERYYERSPINFIEHIRGKLLIVQGAQDPNVTPKNVEDVVTALEQFEIPYEKLVFEDEGHGISKLHNQRILLLRLADFFDSAFSSGT
jgi:dipeptidyl aminopeptidase/acylaminoacyl peptidase